MEIARLNIRVDELSLEQEKGQRMVRKFFSLCIHVCRLATLVLLRLWLKFKRFILLFESSFCMPLALAHRGVMMTQAVVLAQVEQEAERLREAVAICEGELKAAQEKIQLDGNALKQLKEAMDVMREEAVKKDKYLENQLAEKDLTFQQQLQEKEAHLQAELTLREDEFKKVLSQHQESLAELQKKHQAACQRLTEELRTEAAERIKALEAEQQKQTTAAKEALTRVAHLQEELNTKETELLAATREIESEKNLKKEQKEAADAALGALRESVLAKERELQDLQQEKQCEMQTQLDAKNRQIHDILSQRKEELETQKVEFQKLQKKFENVVKELEATRMREAKAAETARRRSAEAEELQSLKKQLERKLLQMQIESHRGVRPRAAMNEIVIEKPGSDVQHTPRQPIKQRRKETQMQVEWADEQPHGAMHHQSHEDKLRKEETSAASEISDIKDGEIGSPKGVLAGTTRRRRPRFSASGAAAVDTPESAHLPPPDSGQLQVEIHLQEGGKAEDSPFFMDDGTQLEHLHDAESGNPRRHSLRLRKHKPEVCPVVGAASSPSPKLAIVAQPKKK